MVVKCKISKIVRIFALAIFKTTNYMKIHLPNPLFAMMLGLCAAAWSIPQASATVIHGSVIFSANNELTPGIYSFDTESPTAVLTPVGGGEGILARGGGVYADGLYYSIDPETQTLSAYDPDTWTLQKTATITAPALDLTYDATEGVVYGCFSDGNAMLGTLDLATGGYNPIGMMRIPPVAMMSAPDGSLYCIGMDGTLFAVNKSDASMTTIGSTGMWPFSAQSATIDPKTGRCYWATVEDDLSSSLYEVNLSNGSVTLIYKFPSEEEITGLFILPEVSKEAPATVENLAANLQGGATSGDVTFTMPSTTVGGEALSGDLAWAMTANDASIASGTSAPGSNVTVPVTLPAGACKLAVSVENEAGQSANSVLSLWVGFDTPAAPATVRLTKTSPTGLSVVWDASTTGEHGGYVDPASIAYNVVRYPGKVSVAKGTAATSLTEDVEAPRLASYWYEVAAVAGELESTSIPSNHITMGAAKVIPFAEDFASTLSFATFMLTDANADGYTWGQNVGAERATYPGQNGIADDWMVTPQLALNADSNYRLKFDVCVNSFEPHCIEVMLGTLPNIADLTTSILPATDLATPYMWMSVTADFHVDADGDYYIGLHAISQKNSGSLDVDNLTVSVLGSSHAPAMATELGIMPHAGGELSADILFNAPTLAIDDKQLDTNIDVALYRGEDLINTFEGVEPGARLSFTDTAAENGFNTYRVVASNSFGKGAEASAKAWIGIDQPGAVSNVKAVEVADGRVEISWEAPAVGINGGYVDAQALTYTVLRNGWKDVARDVAALSCEDMVDESLGQQMLVSYTVIASSTAGEGAQTESSPMMVGTPYEAPFRESFAGGRPSYYDWPTVPLNIMMYWQPSANGEYGAQDADGGLVATSVYTEEPVGGSMLSPKVRVDNMIAPRLEFYVANSAIADKLNVELIVDGQTTEPLAEIDLAAANGWQKYGFDLSAYGDARYVQLLFTCHNLVYGDKVYVDNISILDNVKYNLEALQPECPVRVKAGVKSSLKARVANVGVEAVDAYTVNVYASDVLIAQAEGGSIAAGATDELTVAFMPDAAFAPEMPVKVEVYCEEDQNRANDISPVVIIPMTTFDAPAPTGLAGNVSGQAVELTWNAPAQAESRPKVTTDDFENYPSFTTTEIGNWLPVEGDPLHDSSMEFQNSNGEWILFPGDYAWENMAFTVVDLAQLPAASPADGWNCLSGSKFLMTPYSSIVYSQNTGVPYVGDYLVSPRLNGQEQDVTINAKSLNYNQWGYETIQVLASTTDTEIASFSPVATLESIPAEWTTYTVTLPAGTVHFAIYSVQTQTALFLDDISYVAEGAPMATPEMKGYNVYRDSRRLNPEPVGVEMFTDVIENIADFTGHYAVSAVYDGGESALSDEITVSGNNSAEIIDASRVKVVTTPGQIHIAGAEGLNVALYSTDGTLHASLRGTTVTTVAATPGIYILTVGTDTFKVMVR